MDIILFAIPFFLLLILVELGYGFVQGRNTYRLNDTLNSLAMGSISRLQGLVVLGFSVSIFEFAVTYFQLTQLPDNQTWVWISAFVLYDFLYYWKHRFMHEIALLWGSHVAHHQSEDYNLSTALRQTSIDFHSFIFYLPLFVLGYPGEIIFTVAGLNLIYQFWVHTEHIPKLGPIEWVFVTPSNHRVHHGRNDQYVDTNYGGVFIVWDRLFNSFQDELEDESVYFGLRKPLNSWNPLWANIHVYWRLLLDVVKTPGLTNKFKLLFKPPGWQPVLGNTTLADGGAKSAEVKSACKLKSAIDLSQKYNPAIPPLIAVYCFIQFLLATVLGLLLTIGVISLPYGHTALVVAFVLFSYYLLGRFFEGKRPYAIEGARVLALVGITLSLV